MQIFSKIKQIFKKKNNYIKDDIKHIEKYKETIIPFYLNQRIVYDTLAIINDGFTELYNVSNANNNSSSLEGNISSKIDTVGNPLTLMSASITSDIKGINSNENERKEEFKKVHTPTSLFSKVYRHLNYCGMIKKLEKEEDIDELKSGDFVEFYTKLSIDTTEEIFRKMKKMCNIGEIFTSFGNQDKEYKNTIKIFQSIGEKIEKLLNFLDIQNEKIKYFVGKIGNKNIAIKVDKNNIIDADYDQIKNGDFRIVGKILEVVEDGEKISLNRESVLGLLKEDGLNPIKEAFKAMGNTMFEIPEEIIDEIEGKTIIVVPIVIGI